jgi:hypothetical protein
MPWQSVRSHEVAVAKTLMLDGSTGTFADGVPPIDDIGAPIDELAFVLATDQLSTLEKIRMLEQWRYDELLMQNGATEGLGCERADGVLLQQISRALLRLDHCCH